ncbi:hypothetical protein BTM25_12170 [Actinomadura rubteroloni]|uniref:Uncharacterized protein n=1 Tax=Actinomadura rubteroloni TaxID=1926885 RepID=A0A2P4UP78_9ACTN|nr:hypothetical protein [Actinomadura rubteroloni]POM26809.1 hypothetical protein BTM25_12170 [Actinomadura rubteroloni]
MAIPRKTASLGAAALIAFGGVLSTAASCAGSSCVNSSCTITFTDGARTVEVLDITVRLIDVQGGQARISVGGVPATVSVNNTQQVGPFNVTAEKITPSEVKLKISR